MAVDEKPYLIELAQELLEIIDTAPAVQMGKRKDKALETYRMKLQLAEKLEAEKAAATPPVAVPAA